MAKRTCVNCDSTSRVGRYVLRVNDEKRATFDACSGCAKSVPLSEWVKLSEEIPRRHALRPRPVLSEAEVAAAAKSRPKRRKAMR